MSDRRSARKEIRSLMLFPLLFTTAAGIALLVVGAMSQEQLNAWLAWMAGAGLIVLNVGIWFAFDWARLGYGILGTVMCGYAVFELATGSSKLDLNTIDKPILWGLIAIFAFLPSTKRHFESANTPTERAGDSKQPAVANTPANVGTTRSRS